VWRQFQHLDVNLVYLKRDEQVQLYLNNLQKAGVPEQPSFIFDGIETRFYQSATAFGPVIDLTPVFLDIAM